MRKTNPAAEAPEVLRPALRGSLSGPVRIPSVEAPADLAELLGRMEPGADIRNVFLTVANSPAVAKRLTLLIAGLHGRSGLEFRHREIVILRMAWRCGAEYEFVEHTAIGLRAGLTEEEIERLCRAPVVAEFDRIDALLVDLVDELYDGNMLSDRTWDGLREHFSDAQMIDLLLLAGCYWMIAGVLNSARVELEADGAGWPLGPPVPVSREPADGGT